MSEKMIEWNLAFSIDEVMAGVEKMLGKLGYAFTCTQNDDERFFRATPLEGSLTLTAHPLAAHRSPFNLPVTLHRTLLTVVYAGFSVENEASLKRQLTFAFLRVGG
ncbi:MAG: hypothetical protein HYZ50_17695 [Deltaproteobacteria bacterium]|nr:hypothetical protein [Deltaproteobacteria bacterium]